MDDLRFGYSFWGFLADKKYENGVAVSTPDGNASYSWSIIHEAMERSWDVWLMQKNRDLDYVSKMGASAFKSFSTWPRYDAYTYAVWTHDLPELDVLLLEWRFPIHGRNCDIDKNDPSYQPDLDRQLQLLRHYKERGTKIIIWDLDHKLTIEDEITWEPDAIFETSVVPRTAWMKRTRVEPPFVMEQLAQYVTLPQHQTRKLVYVGSRYERDEIIERWIKPVSDLYPFQVEFWGNWTRESNLVECREMWPNVLYNRRITMSDFKQVYETAVACPILAKESYMESGFITPRPWEALLFGTIPIGLHGHCGIEQYVEYVAATPDDLCMLVGNMSMLSPRERNDIRMNNIDKLYFMDVRFFMDRVLEVVNGQ